MASFDDYKTRLATFKYNDFLKFCKDNRLPVTKHNAVEMIRKFAKKENKLIDFEVFKRLLTEIFFLKQCH